MKVFPLPAAIFGILAAVFLTLAVSRRASPARKAWIRIGLAFAAVSIYLFFFQRHI